MVSPEGFEYYVDRSSAIDDGDDYLLMSDLDYEGSEAEETELPPAIFGCTQETNLKDVPLMAPEFPSLEEGGQIDMREIESIHKVFAGMSS